VVGLAYPEVLIVGATVVQVIRLFPAFLTVQFIVPAGVGLPLVPATRAVSVVVPPRTGEADDWMEMVGTRLDNPTVTVLDIPEL